MFFTSRNLDKLVDDIIYNNVQPLFKSTITKYTNIPYIERSEDGILIRLELPGYESEDLEISIQDTELTIKTIDGFESDSLDSFERSFELIEDINTNTCSAEMKAGVLRLTFKYKKEKKAKKIIIK